MNLELQDKVVLVTAASQGIGRAIAEAFAAEGSKVAITARRTDELQKTARQISAATKAEVIAITADASKAEDNLRMVEETVKRFGTIHVLVNNAGGVGAFAAFHDLTDDDWLDILNLNVLSAVRAGRAPLCRTCRSRSGAHHQHLQRIGDAAGRLHATLQRVQGCDE